MASEIAWISSFRSSRRGAFKSICEDLAARRGFGSVSAIQKGRRLFGPSGRMFIRATRTRKGSEDDRAGIIVRAVRDQVARRRDRLIAAILRPARESSVLLGES